MPITLLRHYLYSPIFIKSKQNISENKLIMRIKWIAFYIPRADEISVVNKNSNFWEADD